MPAIHLLYDTVPGSVHTDPVPDTIKVATAAASLNSTQVLARVGMTVLIVALFVVVVVLISTAVYRGPRIMRFAAALYRSTKEGNGTEVADNDSNDITTSKPKNMEKRSKLQQETILPVTVAPSVAAAAAAALITLLPPAPAYAPPRHTNATSLVRCNAISLRLNPLRRALKAPVPPPPPSASPTIFHEVPSVPEALVPTSSGPPIRLKIQVRGLPARNLGTEQDGYSWVKREVVKPTKEAQKELNLVMMGAFDSDASVSTTASAVTITYDSPTPMNGPVFESSLTRIRVHTLPTSGARAGEAQPMARTIIMDAFADMDPDASVSTIASGISNESFLPMDGPVLIPVPAPIRALSDMREQEAQLVMATTPADFGMEPDISIASSASAITIVYNSPTPMNGPVFEPPIVPHYGDMSDSLESRRPSPPPRPANRLAHYDTSGSSSASGESPMDECDLTTSSSGSSMAPHTFDPFATGINRTSSPRRGRPAPGATGGVLGVVDINAPRFRDEKNIKLEKKTPEGRLQRNACGGRKENWLAAGEGW